MVSTDTLRVAPWPTQHNLDVFHNAVLVSSHRFYGSRLRVNLDSRQLLVAAEISFCGLDRDVPEQELNLIVAEHRVCARDNCKHGREIAAECLSCVRWSATLTQSASLKDCP